MKAQSRQLPWQPPSMAKTMGKPEPQIEVPSEDAKKGAKLFKGKRVQCRTIEKGGNVKGRTFGSMGRFAYSAANKDSGVVWSLAHMFEYLVNPKKRIPGTKMVFAGIKKEKNVLISLHP